MTAFSRGICSHKKTLPILGRADAVSKIVSMPYPLGRVMLMLIIAMLVLLMARSMVAAIEAVDTD
jgi:hypothetical protein